VQVDLHWLHRTDIVNRPDNLTWGMTYGDGPASLGEQKAKTAFFEGFEIPGGMHEPVSTCRTHAESFCAHDALE
jgi:hypothetical protein